MTIAEQLRKTRALLGITQEEMTAGVISESYYSRVERGKNGIPINNLLDILNKNGVSLYDFFAVFDKESPTIDELENRIREAYYQRSAIKLKQLLKRDDLTKTLILEIKLAILRLQYRLTDIDVEFKEELITNLMPNISWNKSELWHLILLEPLLDYEAVKKLYLSIKKLNSNIDRVSVANVLVTFINRAYEEHDLFEVKNLIDEFNKIDFVPQILLQKLIVEYYGGILSNDDEQCENIVSILKSSGYQDYAKLLMKVKNESDK